VEAHTITPIIADARQPDKALPHIRTYPDSLECLLASKMV
jgi:hypothetical protein